jgi:ATP synthase protein I
MTLPGDGKQRGGVPPGADERLKARLDALSKRISEEDKPAGGMTEAELRRRSSALGMALRLATELVVGVFGGGFIGWLLDKWLGTLPLFLVIFLLLGIAAGILNAVREARRMNEK